MTLTSYLAASVLTLVSSHAFATAPMSTTSPFSISPLKTDSAEFCTANDGRVEIIRDFTGGESYIVLAPPDAASKPIIKSGFTYVKQPGGFTQKNEVSFEMFELMVEPFDNEPKDQTKWAKTYEEVFEGKVAVVDTTGKIVATIAATCHAAVVDFK
jgi:hypothetical protein